MGLHMGHVALRVPDVEAYAAHAGEAMGLRVVARDGEQLYLGANPARHEVQLIPAAAAAFDHVGLMVDTAEELDAVVAQAVAAGGRAIEDVAGEPGVERSAVVVGPAGVAHQLYVPSVRTPLSPGYHLETGLRRLGHLTFLSDKASALVAFWIDGLGFRLSDEADGFTWTRCDAYHHTLAVGLHPSATVLHHHAWEIQDVAAMAKYCDRNGVAGRTQLWGPVRHGPGFNIATYMPDAAGALIEVYSDLLTIEDDANYTPVDWSDEPMSLNLWGPMPSPDVLAAGVPVAVPAPAPEGVA
jgi:catechol-2,3-dioxygenase